MEIADPENEVGDDGGAWIDLYAEQLVGGDSEAGVLERLLGLTERDEGFAFETLHMFEGDVEEALQGYVFAPVLVQGYNWDGYIGGEGQADIPYSIQVDVNYTPVPEPPGFVLLATAMIGLVGVVGRKLLAN